MTKEILKPDKCVYVVQAAPDKNYYKKASVFTGRYKKAGDNYRFFMKFDLKGIKAENISSAYLTVNLVRNEISEKPGHSNLYIYKLTEDFDESIITWKTQPLAADDPDCVYSIEAFKKGKLDINITETVKIWANESSKNYGMLIKGEELINSLTGFSGLYHADENANPKLTINYKPAARKSEDAKTFNELYAIKSEYLENYLNSDYTDETRTLSAMVKGRRYKGIVIYPGAAEWNPENRAQLFLKGLAASGYLCFFCCNPSDRFFINETEPNLFVLSSEDFLLPFVKNNYVIVMCSGPIQLPFADLIPNKLLWYDISERLSCFELYDEDMMIKQLKLAEQADVITYSSKTFEEYTYGRKDSVLLSSGNIEELKKIIIKNSKGLLAFSNIDNSGCAAAMTSTFFDFDGKEFYSGGAERYLYDLHGIFEKLGIKMIVYQNGSNPWVRRFENIDVVSLYSENKKVSRHFYDLTELTSLVNIYSAFFEAYPKAASNNIGISHGVAWDSRSYVFNSGEQFWKRNERFIESAKLIDTFVSVDTNTASWFQTIDYNVGINMRYIPNYVDTSRFSPRDKYDIPREKTVILYPRRLYYARGYYMMLDIIDDILKKYPNTEFHFVGRGIEKDTRQIAEKQKQWKDRVKWYALSMNDMPEAYKNSDISVIPSLNSEGTSLSCLEAMASGNAIIATRIGGLSDLVINGYNGIVIDPSPSDLRKALEDLLDHREKTLELKRKAYEVSKVFSKTVWEDRWTDIIKSTVDMQSLPENSRQRLTVAYIQDIGTLDNFSFRNLISKHLWDNDLIYIKIKKYTARFPESFGRLQYLAWEEKLTANADYIIADEKCLKDINGEPDFIIKL